MVNLVQFIVTRCTRLAKQAIFFKKRPLFRYQNWLKCDSNVVASRWILEHCLDILERGWDRRWSRTRERSRSRQRALGSWTWPCQRLFPEFTALASWVGDVAFVNNGITCHHCTFATYLLLMFEVTHLLLLLFYYAHTWIIRRKVLSRFEHCNFETRAH